MVQNEDILEYLLKNDYIINLKDVIMNYIFNNLKKRKKDYTYLYKYLPDIEKDEKDELEKRKKSRI